ncbi:MAG: LON peptidase substrate-binding domain-containing protein [Armatimonadota bacterium]
MGPCSAPVLSKAMQTLRIPIFPLNVVLFPGMLLPLHIFEPRYQEMVRACLDRDGRFGVCLIRSGVEVGGPADPYPVGTTCRILQVTPLGEGKLDLSTVGHQRFRIVRLYHERPYLEAEVELLDDVGGELGDLPARLRDAVEQYVLRMLPSASPEAVTLPDDPLLLSHLAGAVLQISPEERQEVLEIDSLPERLRRQLELFAEEMTRLERAEPERLVARPLHPDPSKFSPN